VKKVLTRLFLDKLYFWSAFLAGIFILLIALLILLQVVARWFGIIIPSTEDFSGYFLATASFLGLAYTLRSNKHIRISLLLQSVRPSVRAKLEHFAMAILVLVSGYLLYSVAVLVYESWKFEELSQGYIAVPLFIVQLGMLLGLLLFAIAVWDSFFSFFHPKKN
jgi:TRAP-type C4-dicarboxylate transport system permease small subunit